jgi:beta-glucosidase
MTGKMRRRLGAAAVPCLAAVLGVGSAVAAVAAVPAAAGAAVARVTGDARVDALIGRMTLDEKLTLLEGSQEAAATNQFAAGYLPGIPRLGIPSLRLVDGPPGVATRQPSVGMTGTMGVAATFSRSDARRNGVVIGRDARAGRGRGA